MLDIKKMQAAFDRAAYKAVHGTREERAGRFHGKQYIPDPALVERLRRKAKSSQNDADEEAS